MRPALLAVVAVVVFVALALLADPSLTGFAVGEPGESVSLEVDGVVRAGEDVRVELPGPVRVRSVRVYGSGILTDDDLVVRIGARSYPLVSVGADGLTGFVVGAVVPSEGSVLDPESVDLDRVVDDSFGGSDPALDDGSGETPVGDPVGDSDEGMPDAREDPDGSASDDRVEDALYPDEGAAGSIDGSVDLVDGGSVDDFGEAVLDAPRGDAPGREVVPESEVRERTLLRYGDGPYDVDDDGRVGPLDAVDFVVGSDAACVVWSVVSESASVFCRGSDDCCRDFGFVGSSGEPASELVLTRESADGVAGSVLAREPDRSFSEPLEFSFSGSAERFVELSGECGSACSLDAVASELVFSLGSGRFTVDRVEVEFEPLARSLIAEERRSYEVSGRSARVQADLSDRLSRGERVRMIVRNESGFFVEDLRKAQFDSLVREGRVVEAVVDQPVSVFTTDALMITDIESVQQEYGLSGEGVTVCVVDTGVDVSLLADTGVSYVGWNVLSGTDDIQDGHGHGTRVAYPLISAAPDASYVFVKALDDSGSGYESDVLRALDECVSRGADVISLSIGSGLYDGLCDVNIVASRVNEIVSNGTLVVAAAGNEGASLLKSPACASGATAVIASDDSDGLWSGSSYLVGHAVLSAPGVSISTVDEGGNTVSASGTSMATPFVSGAAALLLENTSYDPLNLREILVSSGDVFEEGGFSYARLNVENALMGVVTNDLLSGASAGNGTNGSFGVLADPVVSNVDLVFSDAAFQVTYSASDGDSDPLFNTTDWRVNGTSIAVLNAPFNVNVSTTTSGAVHDLTTYGNNGTLSSGAAQPTWNGSCIVGGCYYFDGASDVLSFGDPADGSLDIGDSSWTYGLWVYPVTNVGAYDMPLYKGGAAASIAGYDFELGSGGWGAGVSDGTNGVTAVEWSAGFTGSWYHVMAVLNRDTDRLVLYINGTEVANSSAATLGTVATATGLQLGEQANGNDDFDGYIDEVLIFRRALSPSQVKAIYDAQLEGKSVDLVNESVFGSSDNVSVRVYSSDEAVYSYADSPTLTPISSCQTIDTSGSYYLSQDVSSTGTCITINVSDVALSCGGNTINYSQSSEGYGVLIWNAASAPQNVSIESCRIVEGSSSGSTTSRRPAILGYGLSTTPSGSLTETTGTINYIDDVTVRDVILETSSERAYALHAVNGRYWNVSDVTITTQGSASFAVRGYRTPQMSVHEANITTFGADGYGFDLYNSTNASITSTNVTTWNADAYGIAGWAGSDNWLMRDVNAFTNGTGAFGIRSDASSEWVIDSSTINTTETLAIRSTSASDDWIITGMTVDSRNKGITVINGDGWIIRDSTIDAVSTGIEMTLGNAAHRLRLVNTSFSSVTYSNTDAGYLDVGWWVDAYVDDGTDPLSGANVAWEDAGVLATNPSASGSELTDESGFTDRLAIYEYSRNFAGTTYHSNYTFNATKLGDESVVSHNVTDNVQLNFSIGTSISSCQTISSSGVYTLTQNVTATGTCFEIEADNVLLDCKGYEVEYSTSSDGYGILIYQYDDVSVRNCAIITGSTSTIGHQAIRIWQANNVTVDQTNITMTADQGAGNNLGAVQVLDGSNGTVITNMRIHSSSDESGSELYIFYITTSSADTFVENLTLTSTTTTTPVGVMFWSTPGETIIRNANVTMDKGRALRFYYDSNTPMLIENSIFVNNDSGLIEMGRPGNITFVNVTAISHEEYVIVMPADSTGKESYFYNSTLTTDGTYTIFTNSPSATYDVLRLVNTTWNNRTAMGSLATEDLFLNGHYVDIYVNDTAGDPVSGATVSYTDGGSFSNNPSASGSVTTGADGWARDIIIYDFEIIYWNDNNPYNNYTLDVSATGYTSLSGQSQNINDNTELVFTLESASAQIPISSCQTIDAAGSYALTQDVSSTGTCFTINVSDVALSCGGNTINYSTADTEGYGVLVWAQSSTVDNVSISDCTVVKESSGGSTTSRRPAIIGFGDSVTPSGDLPHGGTRYFTENVTLSDITILTDGDYARAVWGTSSRNWTLRNLFINTTGADARGVYATQQSHGWNLDDVTIVIGGSSTDAIFTINLDDWVMNDLNITTKNRGIFALDGGDRFSISNATIVLDNSGTAWGIGPESGGNNWVISDVNITTTANTAYGLYANWGSDWNVTRVNITTSGTGSYGIYPHGNSGGWTVTDSVITASSASDVRLYLDSAAKRLKLVNVSFDETDVSFVDSTSGYLDVGWWVDAYVDDGSSPVSGANVSWEDAGVLASNPSASGSALTDATGFTDRLAIYEYSRNFAGTTYHSNYTFNATKGPDEAIISHNVTDNVQLNFSIGTPVSSCQTISSSGIYSLTGNLTSTGSCMHITASDVDFTCAGYTINYADTNPGIGVLIDGGLSNVKVRDCVFVQTGIPGVMHDNNAIYVNGSETNRSNQVHVEDVWINKQGDDRGIYFSYNDNSSITRTTVNSSSTSNNAEYIQVTASETVEIDNLTIANVNVTGPQGEFIDVVYAATSLFSNITINATDAQWRVFRLFNGRDNVVENTHITIGGGDSTADGLNVRSRRAVIRNSTITYSGSNTAIQFVFSGERAGDSIVYDTELIYLGGGGTPRSVYMEGGTFDIENVYLVNVTLNKSQLTWEAGQENKTIHFGWRLGAYVNETNGNPVSGVNVSWESVSPTPSANLEPSGSGLTESDGWFREGVLYEYIANATTETYFQNHSVTVSKAGYEPAALQYVNMSTNQNVFFTLEALAPDTYEFTTCSQTGRTGPSQAQCDTEYGSTSLDGDVTVTSGIQTWTVPRDGYWNVTAYGAQGGVGSQSGEGGRGAFISGVFLLEEGQVLDILIGQKGVDNSLNPGGGGGSFVTYENADGVEDLLVAAGGGGGYGIGSTTVQQSVAHANNATSGKDGYGTFDTPGTGGSDGQAGTASSSGTNSAGGGGGFLTSASGRGGASFLAGGAGGTGGNSDGGFGGGGGGGTSGGFGTAGGAGGYSGGGGGYAASAADEGAGGGAGSYNAGDNQTNIASSNAAAGSVVITYMAPPPSARLVIWDGTDPAGGSNIYDVGDQARFFANYSNFTSDLPISGAGNACTIAFDAGSGYGSATSMTYNSSSSFHEYDRNFTAPGTYSYNVSCTSSTYLDLDTTDTISYGNFQVLNATLTPTGDTFTVDYTVTGAASPVNTTDWRSDGVSLAVLNMPFNVNVSTITSGAVTDLSSYSNNGTRGNGVEADSPTWNATCIVGGCYDFNGSQHIRIPSDTEFGITTEITLEAWIYPTAAGQSSASNVIAKPRAENDGHQLYSIRFDSSRVPSFRFAYSTSGISTLLATAAIPLNEWTHVVGTYDGTTQRIYINGVQNNTASISQTIATSSTDVSIGNDYLWNSNRNFIGFIDEPKIYNQVLSADQVLANYNAGVAGEAINTWEGADTTSGENLSVRVYSSNEEEYVYADSNSYEIISACGTISSPGVYALSGDVSSTGACMVISSSDVEFSCGGNTITFSTSTSGRGLSLDAGVENVTISDCQIHQGSSSSSSYALAVIGSTGSRMNDIHVRNVNVSTQGTNTNVGAYFLWVENSTVTNLNSTTVGGSFSDAVWFGDSYNIEYNGGVVYSQNERGVSLNNGTGNSGNIRISNVNVSVDGSGTSEAAFYLDHGDVLFSNVRGVNPSANTLAMSVNLVGDNVTVTDSYLEGPSYPVFVQIAGTITFMNTELENRASGAMMRLYSDTGPLYARLINITTDSATMSWGGSATRRIYWGHWIDAYVNDTAGNPVNGASVDYLADVATNNPSASGTETTASDGTVRFPVYQYTQSPTATDQLNDYTFDASATGYSWNPSDTLTITDDTQVNFTLLGPEIGYCLTIDEPGSYTLANNISAAGTCLTINVSDVSLDCDGYTINYSQSSEGYGVLMWAQSTNVDNVSLSNCAIVKTNSAGAISSKRPSIVGYGYSDTPAGFLTANSGSSHYVDNVSLRNITINTAGDYAYGIYGFLSRAWNVSDVEIVTSGDSAYGLYGYYGSESWTVSNISISTSGSSARGIYAHIDANDWNVSHVDITTSGSSAQSMYASISQTGSVTNATLSTSGPSAQGFYASSSAGWTLDSLNITTSNTGSQGFNVQSYSGTDWFVENSIISASASTDVLLSLGSASRAVRFVNTTFDTNNVSFSSAGILHRGWYVDLYVNDSLGDPLIASINYTDSGALASNPTASDTGLVTGADGYYRDLILYEYSENQTARYSHTNYSFDVASSGYSPLLDQSRNFSDNAQLTFTFGLDTCSPPGSGDWIVEISDNCSVSTTIDIHPNALKLQGSGGTFTIEATGSLTVGDIYYEPDVFDSSSTFIILTGGTLNVKP